ncbi:MAG: carbohydrate ABC transporter permease [Saccharofermentanales bacterium]
MVTKGFRIKFKNISAIRINPNKTLLYAFMIALVAFTSLPLIYVISTAFKPIDEILLFPPRFLFRRPTINNFYDLLIGLSSTTVPFLRYIFNSIYTASFSVVGTVIVSSMAAYAMTKLHVPFGKLFFTMVIIALTFPGSVTQIPSYMVINKLGLINHYSALIIPKLAVAYNMFLMKQFCDQLPNALIESARIDGAREFRIYTKIVMPFLRPAWATLIVFSFVANWNDYLGPLIYISNQEMRTLPLALNSIAENGNLARAGAMAAATFLMILPTVIIFTLMQKRVIETMAHSGIK